MKNGLYAVWIALLVAGCQDMDTPEEASADDSPATDYLPETEDSDDGALDEEDSGAADSDDDTSKDDETATDTGGDELTCPGDFPSGRGPGCCSEPDQLTPDYDRATCQDGEWVCGSGEVCSCQGDEAMFECLDDCDWQKSQPAGCIFSDHFECFHPTTVPADTCE